MSAPIAILVFAALGLLAGGGLFYRGQERQLQLEVERQLGSIAHLKVQQVVGWRERAVHEASEFSQRPLLRAALLAELASPGGQGSAALVREFEIVRSFGRFAAVVLVDARGRRRLAVGDADGSRDRAERAWDSLDVVRAFAGRAAVLGDVRDLGGSGAPHLTVVAPLLPEDPASPPAGAVLLRLDLGRSLLPLVRSWPLGSGSAHAYLVRREGDDAVVLTAGRGDDAAPSARRAPLSAADRAPALAVQGFEGPMRGRDHRGAEVLSYCLAVPGSDWHLVAEIAVEEAFAGWRFRSFLILGMLYGLLGLAAAAAYGLYQGQRRGQAEALYRAEAAAREREAHLGVLFDSNPHPMWIYDLETLRFLAVNDAAVSRYGYSREEFLARTIADIRPPEDVGRLRANVESVREGLDRAGAWRHLRKDGTLIDVEITSHTIDFGGRRAEVVLANDITDRLRSDRALRASEERLSLALRGASDGLWDWDVATGAVHLSPGWQELLGSGVADLPDRQDALFGLLHPDDAGPVREAVRAHFEAGAEFDVEARLRRGDGTYRWFRARARATRDAAGRPVRMAGTFTDIHARKRAELALVRSNRALRTRSACSEALVHAPDERALLARVCESLVEVGGFRLAWVGFAETDAGRAVRPVASAGVERQYLDHAAITWADGPRGRGPTGTALREGRAVVARSIEHDPAFEPWRADALARGYRSSIALPLACGPGAPPGVLNLYASEPDAFDEDEIALLSELADDLGFGLRALRDREARAESDRALQAAARRLQHLLEASPTVLYSMRRVDGGLRADTISESGLRVLGYTAEEALRPGWWYEHVHPDDRERAAAVLEAPSPADRIAHEYRFARADGSYLWVRDEIRVVRDASGTVLEVAGSWTDISERREAEAALRESEERLRLALGAARQGLYDLDVRSGDAIVSPEYATMLGHDPRTFRETNAAWIERLHPDDREHVARTYRDYIAGAAPEYRVEFRQRTTAGDWRWILSLGKVVERDADGRALRMLGTHTDITDRKQAEREREELQSQLLQAQKMELVGRLAGGVAHDFNNMLTVILGHVELALLGAGPAEPPHEHLREIQRAAERSADLTRHLLAFARRQTVAPRALDLDDTLAGMLKLLRRLIGEDIDLVWKPGPDLWSVHMDPTQVDQVVTNLCVNARDAIVGVGRVAIETQNCVLDEAYCAAHPGATPGEYVTLSVSDDGSGMEPHVLEHIFEPFYTTKGVGQGTGLGLAMVYGVVQQNRGCIDVASQPGKGSTFRVHLPRVAGAAEASAGHAPPPAPAGRGETLLLVEDDPAILRLGTSMLEQLGYRVVAAGSAGDALAAAAAHDGEIRLLVTDLIMPGMNGRDLSKTLAASRPGLRTLFVSGYTGDVITHHGVLEPGVQFLAKPFTLKGLADKVRETLDAD